MRQAPVIVAGREIGRGSRVRVRPSGGADVFDLALAGRTATVAAIERDAEGGLHVVVTLDDDPGRELVGALGHRFFLTVEEIEPLPDERPRRRVLVAGIGNVFHGDDGFGVEVVRRLAREPLPAWADVVDFGIRGVDLLYALNRGYEVAILVDAAPRGRPPGTVSLIEPDTPASPPAGADGHGMDPATVLRLAGQNGEVPGVVRLVACEPCTGPTEWTLGLTDPVRAAVDEAVELIRDLLRGYEQGGLE